MDDSEELEHELNYRAPRHDHRFFKTKPPGVNVLTALGAVVGLGTFCVVGMLVVGTAGGRQGPGQSVGALVALVAAVVGALAIPPLLWRAVGPVARQVLRPMGLLGPLPLMFALLLCFAAVVQGVKLVGSGVSLAAVSPRSGTEAPGPRGAEWRVLSVAHEEGFTFLALRLAEARREVAELGPGWRLPREEDLPFINANVKGRDLQRLQFHFDQGDDSGRTVLWWSDERGWYPEEYRTANMPWQVLCVRR